MAMSPTPLAWSASRCRSSRLLPPNSSSTFGAALPRRPPTPAARMIAHGSEDDAVEPDIACSLFGRTHFGPAAGEPPQTPAREQHHEACAKTCPHQELRTPAQPDDRRQEIEQVVGVEAECTRIGLAARSFQSLQRLRPVAADKERRTGPQTERDGSAAQCRLAKAEPKRDEEAGIHGIVDEVVIAMAAWRRHAADARQLAIGAVEQRRGEPQPASPP